MKGEESPWICGGCEYLHFEATQRTTPITNGSDGIETEDARTGVHPSADDSVLFSALHELAAIVRIGKVTDVETKDAAVFVDLDNVAVVVADSGGRVVRVARVARSEQIVLVTSTRSPEHFVAGQPAFRRRNGDFDGRSSRWRSSS